MISYQTALRHLDTLDGDAAKIASLREFIEAHGGLMEHLTDRQHSEWAGRRALEAISVNGDTQATVRLMKNKLLDMEETVQMLATIILNNADNPP